MMLILLLIFICSFIRIDAVGERSFFNEPTDQERAHQALSTSFNALLQERQRALDEGRADEFTPAENSLLDWFDNAQYTRNAGQIADVFDRINRVYDELTPELAERGVTLPPLDELHTQPTIDVNQFRGHLNENMMPGTELDRDIFNHFYPEIFAAGQGRVNMQGTPLGAQQIASPRQSPSPFAAVPYVASRRRLFQDQDDLEPLVLRSPGTPNTPDPLTPNNRRRSRAEAGLENEEGAPPTRRPRPQARRGLIFDNPAPAINPPYNPNPDDENGPNGGGIPVQ